MSQLRVEARPIPWDAMYAVQQEAFRSLAGMLASAVRQLPQPRPSSEISDFTGWLQENRTSQTAFLLGGRGTGKTSVMASLFKFTRTDSTDPLDKFPVIMADDMRQLREHVVWLEPLDMETVNESSNLLAAILVRIEAACDRLGLTKELGSKPDVRGLLEPDFNEPRNALRRIQNTIAVAWDSNLRERRSQLDPDNMAVEVLRYEKSRLGLTENLNKVLNDLAAARNSRVPNPLFVLPVDDFDLNPPACLALLRTLRIISVPRLFFLILGDLTVADVVLNLKMSADLARVAKGVRHAELLSVDPPEVAAIAGEVAANALRKLIPPSQRVELKDLTLVEALNLRPIGYTATDKRLHELLSECPTFVANTLPWEESPMDWRLQGDLRGMLLNQGNSIVQLTSAASPVFEAGKPVTLSHLVRCSYSARHMFETSSRRVVDFWFRFRQLIDQLESRRKEEKRLAVNPPSTAIPPANRPLPTPAEREFLNDLRDSLAEQCRVVLAEEESLSPRLRREIPLAFTHRDDWDLDRLPFRVEPSVRPIVPLAGVDPNLEIPPREQLEIQLETHEGWRLFADPTQGAGTPGVETAPLSESTAATIELFHDLVTIAPRANELGSLVLRRQQRDLACWAKAVWWRGVAIAVPIPWPLPPCLSFFSLDRFFFTWNEFVSHSARDLDAKRGPATAAFAWMSAGTAAVDNSLPLQLSDIHVKPSDWKKLFSQLVTLLDKSEEKTVQAWRQRRWLVNVCLMLMPESGLRGVPFTKWLPKTLTDFWMTDWRLISRLRALRLVALHRKNLIELAENLRASPIISERFQPTRQYVESLAKNVEPIDEVIDDVPRTSRALPPRDWAVRLLDELQMYMSRSSVDSGKQHNLATAYTGYHSLGEVAERLRDGLLNKDLLTEEFLNGVSMLVEMLPRNGESTLGTEPGVVSAGRNIEKPPTKKTKGGGVRKRPSRKSR